jgi:hypothetical protein
MGSNDRQGPQNYMLGPCLTETMILKNFFCRIFPDLDDLSFSFLFLLYEGTAETQRVG